MPTIHVPHAMYFEDLKNKGPEEFNDAGVYDPVPLNTGPYNEMNDDSLAEQEEKEWEEAPNLNSEDFTFFGDPVGEPKQPCNSLEEASKIVQSNQSTEFADQGCWITVGTSDDCDCCDCECDCVEDEVTVSEFKNFIHQMVQKKSGALPDVHDWKEIKSMMDRLYDEDECDCCDCGDCCDTDEESATFNTPSWGIFHGSAFVPFVGPLTIGGENLGAGTSIRVVDTGVEPT